MVAISKPVLVVITACKSALAHQSESVFNGIAQSVLREVPAVVATPFSISEDSTTNFVEQFYRVLGAKQSLLKAVQLASQVMHYYDYEWYRPVIFLRHEGDEDGYLFEFVDLPETNLAINSERGVGLQLSNSKTGGQKILLPDPFMDEETFNHDIKFTGRDDEKKKLEEWLIDQHHNQKIVVISGTSGVGKSTLACEFALQNKKDFPDGIYGVRVNEERFADSKDLPAEIAKEFLTELGLKLDENINNRQIIKKMKECFANREALLIFDNVETDRIIKLFPSGKSSIIVTTTNKTLYKELRNCKPLQLLLPNEVDSQDLEERKRLEKDSLDLFKNLVEEERRNEITQKESTAKEILNLIGYLPLVVKVISRLLNKTNKDLLSLERCLKKLTDERNRWQYLKPNHKSENNKKELDVGYSFALALKDLNPEIQEIFACLGACANSRFSLDLISKTAGFSKDLAEDYLRELEDNYFVKQYYVNEREIYFIPTHNLIHDFAKFLLDKKVDYLGVSIPKSLCRDAKNNHANYFINLVDTDELATQEISKRLYQDIDNLKLACDWLAEPENFNNCNGNYKFIFNESWYAVVNSYRLNNFFIKIIQSFYRTGKKVQLDSYELIELRLKEIRFLRNKHLSKDEISNLEKIGKDIEEKIKNDTKKRVSKIRYSKNIAGLYQRQKKNGINYLLDDAEEAITESIQYLTELDKDKNKNESILKEIKQLGWSDFNSWEMAHCLRRQGLILQRKGKKEKQEQYFIDSIVSFKKSLNIYISIQPDKVPFIQGQLGEAYLELAEVQQDQNQQESVNSFKEAKNFLLQSLNGYRQEQFENVNSISIVLKNLGKTYLALGDLTKAEQYLIESIENDKKLNENGINGRIVPGKELKELIKEYAKQQRSFKNIESLLHQFPNDDRGQVIFLNELADNYIMPKNDENNYENAEKIFFK